MPSLRTPALSDLLKVYPEDEQHCLGYARTQGRRCMCRTNAPNRRYACSLLETGTRRLAVGRSVDELLKNLAPLVLCTRWHQDQAGTLVARWQEKMRTFQQEESMRMMAERIRVLERELASRDAASASTVREQSRRVASEETRRTRTERSSAPTPTIRPMSRSQNSEEREDVEQSETSSTSQASDAPEDEVEDDTARDETVPAPSTQPTVPRREIEGECRICFLSLQEQDDESDVASEASSSDEDDSDDDDSYYDALETEPSSDDESDCSEDEDDDSEELVWCQNQCGMNYHKSCMDTWIATFDEDRLPTCPTCRTVWTS